jgi:hypothetical protein
MKKVTLLLLIVTTTLMSFTTSNRGGWKYIGDQWANYGVDRDILPVTGNDIYTKIKIKVTDAPLNMYDMNIYFENGERQDVRLGKNFSQGEWSSLIDLRGNKRRIAKIEFIYDTKNIGRGKARIAVWGKR